MKRLQTEAVAAAIHELWMAWASKIMSEEKLTPRRRRRWEPCFVPYAILSERMKEIDRRVARQMIRVMKGAIQ